MNIFENEIGKSIEYFEGLQAMMGEKIREKIPFGRGFSTGRSKFDFWALKEGMFYAIECKMQRNRKSFSFGDSTFDDNQFNTLISTEKCGGRALVAARTEIEDVPECFFIRIFPLLRYLNNRHAKSIPVEALRKLLFVRQAKRIPNDEGKILWDMMAIEHATEDIQMHEFEYMKPGRIEEEPFARFFEEDESLGEEDIKKIAREAFSWMGVSAHMYRQRQEEENDGRK